MTSPEQKDSQRTMDSVDSATIIRDALVLQGKLLIDGLRDAVLIPFSLLAALLSLIQRGEEHGRMFYQVVRLGRRSERWINLFAAADRVGPARSEAADAVGLDDYLAQVEARLARELRGGEMPGSARRAIDALVAKIHAMRGGADRADDKNAQQ